MSDKKELIIKYRKEHPRCRYCEYHKWIEPSCIGYWKCLIKDRAIVEWELPIIWIFQGCFCKYFKAKEDNIDI